MQAAVICNNAQIVEGTLQGQPTEGALLACAMKVCYEWFYVILSLSLHWNSAGGILYLGLSVCEWVCVAQKLCEHHVLKNSPGNFTQFWSRTYLAS